MLALFPLPLVLFPGALLPLHVFEPRYRALLADVVAGAHRFGLVVPDDTGRPEVGVIGTVARIRAIQPLPDGRSQIVVSGESRFRLRDIVSTEHPYLVGDTEPYEDEPDVQLPTTEELGTLENLGERYAIALAAVEDGERAFELSRDPALLTFQIAGLLDWDLPTKVHFLALQSTAGRVIRLLHGLPTLLERIESYALVHQRAASNGSGIGNPMSPSAELVAALGGVVGPRWVRSRTAERRTYEADGLPTHSSVPLVAALPGTREEVIALVRLLHERKLPWVARGAGTGLSGGALADTDAVLIPLTRLNRILAIDPAARRATIEPGVVNARLSDATRPHGLLYAPDPSSQSACTLGGNVAENAGGPHCLKYGVTTNHVVAVEVILPDGSLARLGSPEGDPWGPDLVGLFVGSEGMFGIAVAITVRLEPIPAAVRTLLADFPTIRSATEAVTAIIASGIVPAALEMMDQACVRAVEASIYAAGYPTDAGAVLLAELDGTPESVAAEALVLERLIHDAGARSIRSADSAAERARLWQGRKKAFGAMGRVAPDLVVQDAVVPRSSLPDILDTIGAIGREYGLVICNVFHAGDGNLHPNICYDRRDADLASRVARASRAIMEACVKVGGSITGEHGVGADKLEYMPLIFDPPSLAAMCAVRRAFDPYERANPRKVVPIRYCREWAEKSA